MSRHCAILTSRSGGGAAASTEIFEPNDALRRRSYGRLASTSGTDSCQRLACGRPLAHHRRPQLHSSCRGRRGPRPWLFRWVGHAHATEAIAECIRRPRVREAKSNIGLLAFCRFRPRRAGMRRARQNASKSRKTPRKPPGGRASSTRCGKSRSFARPTASRLRRLIWSNPPRPRASPPERKPIGQVRRIFPNPSPSRLRRSRREVARRAASAVP
jgi:hypothetical protein